MQRCLLCKEHFDSKKGKHVIVVVIILFLIISTRDNILIFYYLYTMSCSCLGLIFIMLLQVCNNFQVILTRILTALENIYKVVYLKRRKKRDQTLLVFQKKKKKRAEH